MSQHINNDKVNTDGSVSESENAINNTQNNLEESVVKTDLKKVVLRKKSFFERWKNNRFWLIKGTYYFLHYTWVVVMAIGAFIAWLVAMLFI